MNPVLSAVLLVVIIGLVASVILVFASKKFEVKEDEKFIALRAELPGANCGGCGFAGCDDYAHALCNDPSTPCTKCAVGGPAVAEKLAAILGTNAGDTEREVAFVMCNGTKENAKTLYDYEDISSCKAAKQLFGGNKSCPYGCIGLGDCVDACEFDSIAVCDGVAVVNRDTCVACGACTRACPNHLIKLLPESSKVIVQCHSEDKGAVARGNCQVACIGCGMCERTCMFDAIHVNNNLASIDPEKCKKCGMCVVKCPTGAILDLLHTPEQKEKIKAGLVKREAAAKAKRAAAAKKPAGANKPAAATVK